MNCESTFSRIVKSAVFFIRNFTVPAFVIIVTAGIVAAVPISISPVGTTYISEIRASSSTVYGEYRADPSDSRVTDPETVTSDRMDVIE